MARKLGYGDRLSVVYATHPVASFADAAALMLHERDRGLPMSGEQF